MHSGIFLKKNKYPKPARCFTWSDNDNRVSRSSLTINPIISCCRPTCGHDILDMFEGYRGGEKRSAVRPLLSRAKDACPDLQVLTIRHGKYLFCTLHALCNANHLSLRGDSRAHLCFQCLAQLLQVSQMCSFYSFLDSSVHILHGYKP